MTTRSLTRVLDREGNELINIYRQMDGYPEGHGVDLAKFLRDITMVNGLDDTSNVANGMECLAAQLITHLKNGPGGIYLYPESVVDAGQDYEYVISQNPKTGDLKLSVEDLEGGELFTPKEFLGRYDNDYI